MNKTSDIMDDEELLYREMNEDDEWYMGPESDDIDDMDSAEYDDFEDIEEEELHVLKILKDGKYKVKPLIEYGMLFGVDTIKSGFNRVEMFWDMRQCPMALPVVNVQVLVDGIVIEYDALSQEWIFADYDNVVIDRLEEWLNEHIDTDYHDMEKIKKVAIPTLTCAEDHLHGFPYYEIDGDLYFYYEPVMPLTDEEQQKVDELMSKARKLKKREAAKMLKAGNFEIVDAPDDMEVDEDFELLLSGKS